MVRSKPGMKSVCVIPSRAGTKDKGLWALGDMCLAQWVMRTCKPWRTIVTTDQLDLMHIADLQEIEYRVRPEHLCDGNHMVETIIDVADHFDLSDDTIIHVCQPTSPFLRRVDLRDAETVLSQAETWSSFQTITPVLHNSHEFNQRTHSHRSTDFVNRQRRLEAKTKQDKPSRWIFGNLVSVLAGELRRQRQIFATPSYGHEISRWYSLDVDNKDDLKLAEAYLSTGLVTEKEILA